MHYKDFDIQPEYRADWDRFNFWKYVSRVDETVIRAYSMANYPDEKGIVKFNIRVASPPPGKDEIPPGKMSSWVFNLAGRQGHRVRPLRRVLRQGYRRRDGLHRWRRGHGAHALAHLRPAQAPGLPAQDQLLVRRALLREAFYTEEYDQLAAENPNFQWHLALSDPQPEDNWTGYTGFIHNVLFENYLKDHPAPRTASSTCAARR